MSPTRLLPYAANIQLASLIIHYKMRTETFLQGFMQVEHTGVCQSKVKVPVCRSVYFPFKSRHIWKELQNSIWGLNPEKFTKSSPPIPNGLFWAPGTQTADSQVCGNWSFCSHEQSISPRSGLTSAGTLAPTEQSVLVFLQNWGVERAEMASTDQHNQVDWVVSNTADRMCCYFCFLLYIGEFLF